MGKSYQNINIVPQEACCYTCKIVQSQIVKEAEKEQERDASIMKMDMMNFMTENKAKDGYS